MICPICKSNIRDDSVFCPVCGKPVPQQNPDIHNIETVELPKRADEVGAPAQKQEISHSSAREEASMEPERKESVPPVQAPSGQNQASYEGQAVHPDRNGMAQREQYRQDHARPHQTGRQSGRQHPRYQSAPGHGGAPREADSRSNARRNVQNRPLSEKEAYRLRNNLSKKALVAFIFGIFGLCAVAINLPCSIVGLVFSIIVRNEYRDRGWRKDTDLKLANAAFICSIIGLVVAVIGIIVIMMTGAGILAALGSLASGYSGSGYYGF